MSDKVPEQMQHHFEQISELTSKYCSTALNDEYAQLAKIAIATLCRKRPSPLLSGKINVWACSIVYALGQANFLFDNSQEPYATPDNICDWFGVSKSTAGNKAKIIRDLLKINYSNHKWKIPSQMENSSFVWMVEYKGFAVDVRTLPLEVQIVAYQKGMIP
jgi:hypothetical protein